MQKTTVANKMLSKDSLANRTETLSTRTVVQNEAIPYLNC